MTDKLLTANQVADRLSISTRKLRSLVTAGDIAFIAIGNGGKRPFMRFEVSEVEDFIQRQRRQLHPPKGGHSRLSAQSVGSVDFLAILEKRKQEERVRKQKLKRSPIV